MVAEAIDDYGKAIELATSFGRYVAIAWAHADMALAYYSVDKFEHGRLEAAEAREYSLKAESAYLRAFANAVLSLCESRLNRIQESEKLCGSALEAVGTIWNSEAQRDRTPLLGLATLAFAELLAAKRMVFKQ